MKVITIKQPWATLIVEGYKNYEFRTWNTKYRGSILIHAAKTFDKNKVDQFKDYNLEYPTGCILAKVDLTESYLVDDSFAKSLLKINPLVYKNLTKKRDKNLYGFKLENIRKIKPIYLNGQLGLWNYERCIE